MRCDAMLCYAMLCYAMICYAMSSGVSRMPMRGGVLLRKVGVCVGGASWSDVGRGDGYEGRMGDSGWHSRYMAVLGC